MTTSRPRPTWDETWLAVADVVALRSRCDRRRCAAVIVDAENRVVSTGYNGPPRGYAVEGDCGHWCPRACGVSPPQPGYEDCFALHAEQNALLFSERSAREGGTIYVTSTICFTCARLVANSGLVRAVMRVSVADAHRQPERTVTFLRHSGIEVNTWPG